MHPAAAVQDARADRVVWSGRHDLPRPHGRRYEMSCFRGYEGGRFHAAYPPEFKRRMVELVRSGRAPEELAPELEASAIRCWVKQAELDEGGPRRLPVGRRDWRRWTPAPTLRRHPILEEA